MKITSYVSFLYCLCLMLASPTVQASEVRTAIFEGKPCINPPHVVGNKICNFITYWFTVTYNVYQRAVLNLVSFWYHYITFVIISLNFISYIFLLYF